MLDWWSDSHSRFDLRPCETIIWNNNDIRINGKLRSHNNYNSANIILLSNLKFDLTNTESLTLRFKRFQLSYLDWYSLRCTK